MLWKRCYGKRRGGVGAFVCFLILVSVQWSLLTRKLKQGSPHAEGTLHDRR
jgi:hypothetical protein